MEDQLISIFERIGMSKNETKIYLELLKNNSLSAWDLASKTNIHRSNTYDAIGKLKAKGFVSEIIDQKKRLFTAMPPEKIKSYLKQQEREFDSIIPSLSNFSMNDSTEERVEIINGIFSIREKLYDLLKFGSDINVYGASLKSVESFGEGFLNEFHKERIKKKVIMRHIYDETALNRVKFLNKKQYTEAKYLSKKYNTNASTILCGDLVIIVVFGPQINGIVIKNKEIYDTYNKHFDLLWREAKNIKTQSTNLLIDFNPKKNLMKIESDCFNC